QDRVYEFNKAAAEVARQAADAADRPVLVAGSIGPSGELLQPMGNMSYEQAVAAFAEQARGLSDGGADLLWVETMSDINEVRAAVEGAKSVSDLPVVATMSFDTNGRTMMGITATEAAEAMAELGLAAFGANCGNNLPDTEAAIVAMHEAKPDALLVAKANAGIPRWGEDGLEYDGTPDVMANFARRVNFAGASLIGGCCGSSPAHIGEMRLALDNPVP
ncbi:MAG: homocysteine S-methyltransferase family protein, partial [Anaerolineales bacterium]|nr:homocysteine S-methyltransferase family protein [Anaerolineales bacterium]